MKWKESSSFCFLYNLYYTRMSYMVSKWLRAKFPRFSMSSLLWIIYVYDRHHSLFPSYSCVDVLSLLYIQLHHIILSVLESRQRSTGIFSMDNEEKYIFDKNICEFFFEAFFFHLAISILDGINGGRNSEHERAAQSLTLPKL